MAKYHKSNEWPGLSPPYDEVATKEIVTYNSSFGVEFGIFTCFDIVHYNPPVKLVNQGIKHFLYPVKQGEIGEVTLIQGWSKKHSVTVLSANLGSGSRTKDGDEKGRDCSGIIQNGQDLPTDMFYLKDSTNNAAYKESADNVLIGSVPV